MRNKAIDKAFRAYDKAEHELIKLRDSEYPPGTMVKFGIMDWIVHVQAGSLYPDQVLTSSGHVSWRHLKKVNISTVEKTNP